MPPLDPTLLSILSNRPDAAAIAGGFTQWMQQKQAMEAAAAQAHEQALMDAAQRHMQQIAMNDPAILRMRRALEAPVEPFHPDKGPASLAPGAGRDVRTLEGALSGLPDRVVPVNMGPNGPTRGVEQAMTNTQSLGAFDTPADLSMGALTLTPTVKLSPLQQMAQQRHQMDAGVVANSDAWNAPGGFTPEIGEPMRRPLVQRAQGRNYEVARQLARRDVTRVPRGTQGETRPDLSPEGLAMYEKLAPELRQRRQTEETTRRTLEAAQMNNQTREREAQLRSGTDLVRSYMDLMSKAQLARERAMRGSKDDALKWYQAAQEAYSKAQSNVQHWSSIMNDPNDPQRAQAVIDLENARREVEWAKNNLGAPRGRTTGAPPKPGGAGGTKSFKLDANGQLVPG
jgi:hypothetical protein